MSNNNPNAFSEKDLIDRQAAIDALERLKKDISGDYTNLDPLVMAGTAYIGDCIGELQDLPSAQPEPIKINIKDFSKEDLERLKKECGNTPIIVLPAQPEIIRCKDCKFNPKHEWFGCPMSHLSEKQRPETAWCWKAERRTDEAD